MGLITISDITSNVSTIGVATLAITVPGGGIPAKSRIIIGVVEGNTNGASGTIADTAGNVYTLNASQILNNSNANGNAQLFSVRSSLALSAGNTITYTCSASNAVAMAGLFVVGVVSLEQIVPNFGSSSSPTASAAAAKQDGEAVIGFVMWSGGSSVSFTQDSTNAAYATPPDDSGITSTLGVAGGSVINTGHAAITYNPTFGISRTWAAFIGTLAPFFPNAEVGLPELSRKPLAPRSFGIKSKSEFGIFPNLQPMGWEVQAVQPPHPRPERSAAVIDEDDGNEATKINFVPFGHPIQPSQPPHPRPEKAGAILFGDPGNESPLLGWKNGGWEIAPHQPAHPRPERSAALARGDDGSQNRLLSWFNSGWEFQILAWPHPRSEKAGAVMRGDDGTQLLRWVNSGWEVVPPQLPHPRPERTAAILAGDTGTEAKFVPPITASPWAYDLQWLPPRLRPERSAATKGKSEFGIFPNSTPYWDDLDVLRPFPRWQRVSATLRGDDGIQAVKPVVAVSWGYEFQWPAPRPRWELRGNAIEGTSQFAIPSPPVDGWEAQFTDLSAPIFRRSGAIATGDTGIEAKLVAPVVTVGWGYEQIITLRAPIRKSDLSARDDAMFPLITFRPTGWEIIPVQPSHPRPEQRAAAIMRGDDGSQAPLIFWRTPGWEVAYTLIPHPRPERSGAIMFGDTGTEAALFVAPVPNLSDGWEIASPITLHPRPERIASMLRGDEGIQARLLGWFNAGWEIQTVQPPRPRWERFAGTLPGDPGNEAPKLAFNVPGWEVAYTLVPHPRPERVGAILLGDDGTQAALIVPPTPKGWDIAPPYIAHPRPERSAAWLRGHDGVDAKLIQWFAPGWEVQSYQPPHRAPEFKHAAVARGDDGAYQSFIRWFNAGWEVAPILPPHPKPERTGSIMFGDTGAEAIFIAPIASISSWGYEFLGLPRNRPRLDALFAYGDVTALPLPFVAVYRSVTYITSYTSKTKTVGIPRAK